LGALALAENHRDEARAHFERASGMGSHDAVTQFQLAMLVREGGGSAENVNDLLKSALDADPNFGEAHFLLGSQATDDGNFDIAVDQLKIAAQSMPKRSYVWYALAFAQMKLGQPGDARTSAIRAVQTATTVEEEGMAEALLDSLSR
jgi:Tfp pilus assembly protein PilF